MSRLDPKNREEAFTYQFEDDIKVLRCAATQGATEFEQALSTLEIHIVAYRSKRLKNVSAKVKEKRKEHEAWMAKNYPGLRQYLAE